MVKDILGEQDANLFKFYTQTNETCRKSLQKLRRSYLNIKGSTPYSLGEKLPVITKGKIHQLKSIFYSDKLAHSQVVYELMTAMRAWVVANANNKQSIVFIIKGSASEITIFANTEAEYNNRESLEAAFPGITFGDNSLSISDITTGMKRGGIITGIPAFTDNEHEQLYSLDRFIRGLRGKNFTLIISGNPYKESELDELLADTRKEIGANHELIKRNISKQFGEGTARTLGGSFTSFGALMEALTNSTTEAKTKALTVGGHYSKTKGINIGCFSESTTKGLSIAGTIATTLAETSAKTSGQTIGSAMGVNYSVTKMQNKSHSNTLERLNQFAEAYEEALLEHQARLKSAIAEGGWRTVTYLLAENDEDFKYAASLFNSCLTAHFDAYEPFRIIPLANVSSDWTTTISTIPEISVAGSRISLATTLTSSEFSSLMSLPTESYPGVEIRSTPRFSVTPTHVADKAIPIGNICDREVMLQNKFAISENDLNAHTLVAGLTGMGKSTTIREILRKISVPFLIIEPAKSEYRNMSIDDKNIRVYTAGDENVLPLRLNPFEVSAGDTLHSHIDAIAAILNAAFPMEGPMSALIEQGLVKAYQCAGWDVTIGKAPDNGAIPTMDSFYDALSETIEEQKFQGDYGANIKSALLTRINSLRIGPRGRLFNSEMPFNVENLLSEPTVIEMKKVGNDETKAFLSGLILLRIYKYLEMRGSSNKLCNLLVIEEAHRMFRRAESNNNSLVGNNTTHHAVEIFENIMAEVRAYGLGIVIAEQLPLRLSDGAVKNTNLKIIHRLGALEDAILMGGSMGLNANDSSFICRMKPGEAIAHSASMSEPSHVKISFTESSNSDIISDAKLREKNPRMQASENRPVHFDEIRIRIEKECPRELERLADKFLFTIMMLPISKKEKWNYAWNECITNEVQVIAKKIKLNIDTTMAAHLFHAAVMALLKSKRVISEAAPLVLVRITQAWDISLTDMLKLKADKIQEIRENFTSEEVYTATMLPSWLPKKYPSIKKLYPEAKQMAAAIKANNASIQQYFDSGDINNATSIITRFILDRTIKQIDVKGETLVSFAFATSIALLNWIRPPYCTTQEYLAKIENAIELNFQERNK